MGEGVSQRYRYPTCNLLMFAYQGLNLPNLHLKPTAYNFEPTDVSWIAVESWANQFQFNQVSGLMGKNIAECVAMTCHSCDLSYKSKVRMVNCVECPIPYLLLSLGWSGLGIKGYLPWGFHSHQVKV